LKNESQIGRFRAGGALEDQIVVSRFKSSARGHGQAAGADEPIAVGQQIDPGRAVDPSAIVGLAVGQVHHGGSVHGDGSVPVLGVQRWHCRHRQRIRRPAPVTKLSTFTPALRPGVSMAIVSLPEPPPTPSFAAVST